MNTASYLHWALAAVACIFFAMGILVLDWSRKKNSEKILDGYLNRSLQRKLKMGNDVREEAFSFYRSADSGVEYSGSIFDKLLNAAGCRAWGLSKGSYIFICLLGFLLFFASILHYGVIFAFFIFVFYLVVVIFFVWRSASKKRKKMLEQLPNFLDNMVRLVVIGNSTQGAFQGAAENIPMPLKEPLEQASSLLVGSSDLGMAMEKIAHAWGMQEFSLLAAIFRMSTRYGGRTDQVLERVSSYIRDKLSAERELHAMSAEVRLSAWILSLLPIVVGGMIMLLNEGYFMRMWNDVDGQKMIFIAMALEAFGVLLLYRLAKLR